MKTSSVPPMPSVWDMMDLLNIPDCKVTAFRVNSANFFSIKFQQSACGKVFQKKDMKTITDIIFQKCNYYNKKSQFNNKNLVKNNGKLMFTSGLTINDFSSKYNF